MKIAAIGIRVKKWIAYLGFSLNVSNDLTKYDKIVPCGIKDKGITSLRNMGINNYDDIKIITRDYVQISFDSSCWNDELRNNVDSGIEDLRKIVQLLKKIKGVVRIFIVPPVFAFEDEGALIKGRLSMSQNAAVTTEPLAQYIADAMSDFQVEVISLEKVIRKHKLIENENLFFQNGSHWNREMNRYLGNYLTETIYK